MYHKIIAISLSLAIAISIILDSYFVLYKPLSNSVTSRSATADGNSSSTSSTASSSTSNQQNYKDGEYVGKSITTAWGNVQLKIKITDNRLTQITVLKYPNTHSHSVEINQRVLPIYRQEAVKSQSANIQQVSGATETWKGFTGSLQSALVEARQA
ncbi:FMN-binding protein [Liquorilactobacillus mali]|uniref:FMN-binding domain-containing protein n=2 Tax=Liquorilactobacillus mali TaxID=1618 RepID=J1F5I8_9LACO|nr:FMN-binding protein [Liquorilactobacillus mali]EJF01636.1 hypothetical protein LMA_00864 [Liquorilactobacillus mali KCTC 3596 = DSM 20444]KRN09095.1 hypothetical protein FD00_GL001409 [Liquorilactobacillus mali KCTC 3596 = DSM 20444]KRN33084.1 hypothetical protein IV36_GL000817 [Liquorilactobacillus mali]MDC7952224.1 FMN-binding protein [Liquorilactobacillus mali]MDN7145099.1 FMN-binding protein [Liquorilactobacillus mali]